MLAVSACSPGGDEHAVPRVRTAQPPAAVEPGAEFGRRPNLLVIEADDMRTDDLRWMPRTRRLLGEQGLTFHNSFSNNPLCCPSRASFLTGRHSHNHRVLSHVEPYGFSSFDDSTTIATALQGVGYRTALVGKYLNGYGITPTYLTREESTRYVPPGWTQWYGGLDDTTYRVDATSLGGTYSYFHLTSNVNGEVQDWPGEYNTDVTARQTQDMISAFDRRGDARPWFVWWTPVAPHHGGPREADDPGTTVRPGGGAVAWVTPARPGYVKGRFDDRIPRGSGVPADGEPEAQRSDKPRWLRGHPPLTADELTALRNVTRQRAESLAVLDDRVAETLAHLRRLGEATETLVVFTSDNGYYLGEHRKRQGKITLYEPSARVPLLMRGPGVEPGDRFAPISTVDLAVTLARLAGARLPQADGADLRHLLAADTAWRTPVVLEGRMPESSYALAGDLAADWDGLTTSAVRVGRFKLIRYATGETELYDLARDPLELEALPAGAAPAVRLAMERLWQERRACAGARCRTLLPPLLTLTRAEARRLTLAQAAAERTYFGRLG